MMLLPHIMTGSMDIPCPDGFLLSPDDPLFFAHTRLNEYLVAEEERGPATAFDMRPWKKLAKRDLPGQTMSVLARLQWLDQHDRELDQAHKSRMRVRSLLRVLYSLKADFTESELIAIIDATTPLLGRIVPYGPIERVAAYLKNNNLTPGLCQSIRRFQSGLREEMSESQASMQSLRQIIHILLWMDEWEPLDPTRCWSECIRRDFREMSGDRRINWRALLKHLRGNAPVRMPKGWANEARPLLDAVGIEDFVARLEDWFAPFRSGQPLPLSVPGSHVLKCLIWYCVVSGDERAKETALWLRHVKWRQKRNTEKSLVALTELGVTREELIADNLIRESKHDSLPQYLERLRQSVVYSSGRIANDPDEDVLIVQGQMHFYRVFRSTGRIERATDGAVLELDWHSLPDQFRLTVKRECDSPDEVQRRALLLISDGTFAQYFRVKANSD